MVSVEDLRKILILQNLNDGLLESLMPHMCEQTLDERDVVFEEGQKAEDFFMLKRGKILLEVSVSDIIIISLGSIKSGYSFGWSALIPESNYTSFAVCSEPCQILSIPGTRMLEILRQEPVHGYRFMENAFRILKNRLERRTGQFLKVMAKHPDIQKLLGL